MSRTSSITKEQAIELLAEYKQSGNQDVLAQLYTPFMEMILAVGLKYYKDKAKAEDLVIHIYEKLVQKAKTNEVSNFSSWLYTLAKNECLMQLRKKKEILVEDFSYQTDFVENEAMLHLFSKNEDTNQISALKTCLEKLNKQQQTCIQQFYIGNKSYKEVAEDTNFTLKEVKSFIQNGKRNLKNCIEKNGK